MIEISEVKNQNQRDLFINLPWILHQNHKQWVPPLLSDEKKLFDSSRNPAFSHCQTIMLLAHLNGDTVGRAMGIIHKPYNNLNNERTARFGFIETTNNQLVFKALINYISNWAKKNSCTKLVGPFGFSDKDPQGFLTEGFDGPTVIVTNCSFNYMADFTKSCGFEPFLELVQYKLKLGPNVIERLQPFAERALRSRQFKVKSFTSTRQIKPFIPEVFALMNHTYRNIYGFAPITTDEANEFAKRFLPLLNPQLIKFVFDHQNNIVAFIIGMADISEGLRKSNGRIMPLGWWHLLKAMRKSKRIVLLLGAVSSELRHKGLDAVIGFELIKSAMHEGFEELDSHLILAENHNMRRELERINGAHLYKRYTIFQKTIDENQ